jgi:arachidonate 15-lipoxygenase
VRGVLGPAVTLSGVAELLATIVHLAVVEHEITGSGLWSYQLWSDTSPVRMYEDGRRVPVDVYQRLVNANLTLNVNRTMLLNDGLAGLALDERGAWAFREFQQDLLGLQVRLDREAPAPWRIEPRHLKANINA